MKSRIFMQTDSMRIVGNPEIKSTVNGEEYLSFKAKFDDDTEIYKMQMYADAPDYGFAVDQNKNILLKKGKVYQFNCQFTQKTEAKKTETGELLGYTVSNFYKVLFITMPIPGKEYNKLPKKPKNSGKTNKPTKSQKSADDILAQFGEV